MIAGKRKEIRWQTPAKDDFVQIVDTIAADAPGAAERFAESILSRVELLAEFPYLGPVCPYYRKARQLIHGSYIVYYTVHQEEGVVRAVVHGARLFRSYWLRRKD
jgi:toxin ParE1/3/4